MERTIYDVVGGIQAKKERYRIDPPFATFQEIKAEIEGIDDGTLYAILEAEEMNGLIVRRRTINGYAFVVTEE